LSKYIDPNKTAAENQAIILQSMQDKNSPVNKAIQANKDATNKAEMQKLLVDIEKNTQDNTVKIQIANINKDIENGKLGDAKAKTKVLQDELTAKKDAGYFKPNTTAPINWFTT
jgi:ankyrin repeat protein